MKLSFAMRCGERLVQWLEPFCDRLEVAGSVRRLRPTCNDIDLVAIGKVSETHDLFGKPVASQSLLVNEVRRRFTAEGWPILRSGPEVVAWVANGMQVDLFLCTAATWGTVMVCRTGSKEHNIWLATAARACGGNWVPNAGVFVGGNFYRRTEEEVYAGIGLPMIDPIQREAGLLPAAGARPPLPILEATA